MRVALFTDTFVPDVNGVAKTLGRWVNFLEAHGVECRVFAPQSPAASDSDQWLVERFYSIPFMLYPECRMAIPNPVNLNRTLKAFAPDLIHVATPFNLGLVGLRYGRRHGIPVVASYHTHFDQYLAYYKLQWMEPMLWKYILWFHQGCRRVYVPSRSTLLHLQEKGLQELEIWSRGVEAQGFHPIVDRGALLAGCNIPEDSFVMLYVGRLAVEKSIDVLMSTWGSLPGSMRERSHLVIAGDGPLLQTLREQYRNDGRVHFTGFLQGKSLSDWYAAADVFLFPSATETFGNVVLEAMASGTPVIGANAGGVADTVRDGVTGLLAAPGSVPEFTAAVQRLYESPELRAELSRQGRSYSMGQSWEAIFQGLYRSYRQVLDREIQPRSRKSAISK